jgi:hypothetical protein
MERTLRILRRANGHLRWAVLLLPLVSSLTVFAQQSRLSIAGKVNSSDGRAVAGALIRVTDIASKEEWTSTSTADGAYQIKGFRPGIYQLAVEAAGYGKLFVDNLRLVEATNRDINLDPVANRYYPWPEQTEYYIAAIDRILPALGPGLRALVRKGDGNYYALTDGSRAIEEYSPSGAKLREIPSVTTGGSGIVYGVSLSIDQSGRLYVADQGSNAVKIFDPSGELTGVVRANAPVSVQGIQEGEIAVQQLGSTHLVTVLDRRGAEMRRYIELPPDSEKRNGRLPQHWRFYSDSSGNIYCSVPVMQNWIIRKYDLYGVTQYEMSIPSDEFGPQSQLKKIAVVLTPSIGLPGMGIMSGMGMGGAPGRPGAAMPSNDANGGEAELPLRMNKASKARATTATLVADANDHGVLNDLAGSAAATGVDRATGNRTGTPDAVAALESPAAVRPTEAKQKLPKNNSGEITVSEPDSNISLALSTAGVGRPSISPIPGGMAGGSSPMVGVIPMGIGGMGMMGPMSGGMPAMMSSAVQWIKGGLPAGGMGGPGGSPGAGTGGPPKGGFGLKNTMGMTFDVTIRPDIGGPEIVPDVDAIGVDPDTEEVWMAIGGKLLHFNKEGNRIGTYAFAATGVPVKPVSLIVERRRILVATDPFGVYVYPRPDIVPMLEIGRGQQ